MRILTPRSVSWPQIPEDMPDEWKQFLTKLKLQLDDFVKDVYNDIASGNSTFKIDSSAPTASELNEGELFLYDDNVSTRRVYTRINGALRYISFT